MSLLNYLLRKQQRSAAIAKERLQIILAREHADREGPDFLPQLKRDLLEVVSKYVNVNLDDVQINLERDGNCEILELNIILPESEGVERAVVR